MRYAFKQNPEKSRCLCIMHSLKKILNDMKIHVRTKYKIILMFFFNISFLLI